MNYLEINNILYRHQYGFRPKHSTIHPIIHFLNHCADACNKTVSETTLALFCDLSKAFDVINHDILLTKLATYGIRGIALDWFTSYLSDRKQYVSFNGVDSSYSKLNHGVPQGSILGPLLFLIYVNDICISDDLNILSFADDTTIFMLSNSIKMLFEQANANIKNMYEWFCCNKPYLNASKTKYMLIKSPGRQIATNKFNVWIGKSKIDRIGNNMPEKAFKCLGIYIDETLTWKHQITYVN